MREPSWLKTAASAGSENPDGKETGYHCVEKQEDLAGTRDPLADSIHQLPVPGGLSLALFHGATGPGK